ncbi:MAG: sugar transferase [Clostridia bacterium]|nr:sugar transferase [Clostridia bacterium]
MKKKETLIDAIDIKSLIRSVEGTLEVILLCAVYYIACHIGYPYDHFFPGFALGNYILAGVYGLLVAILFASFDGFKFGYLRITEVLLSQWIALCIVNFVTYWQLCLVAGNVISPLPLVLTTLVGAAVSFLCTISYTFVYHRLYVPKNMVMIFGRDKAVTLKFKMETRPDKYRIVKLIPAEEGFDKICEQIVNYDAVVINDIQAGLRNDILKFCYKNEIRTYLTPKISDIIVHGATNINLFDTPLALVKGIGLSSTQRIVKRFMDLLISLFVFIIASPIMLLVALAIKLEDGGPVFYKQARVSLDGKVFNILKFRSMIVDAEKDGLSIPATGKDPRITKIGQITRATRIDELPQLLNIIKGDMSIVGPRPERVEHMQKYGEMVPEFDFRTKVKGGLTGYAQVYGKYNTSPYDKLRLDMMYIENYSLLLDIKLILMTIRIMLTKESVEGFETIEQLENMAIDAAEHCGNTAKDTPSVTK